MGVDACFTSMKPHLRPQSYQPLPARASSLSTEAPNNVEARAQVGRPLLIDDILGPVLHGGRRENPRSGEMIPRNRCTIKVGNRCIYALRRRVRSWMKIALLHVHGPTDAFWAFLCVHLVLVL